MGCLPVVTHAATGDINVSRVRHNSGVPTASLFGSQDDNPVGQPFVHPPRSAYVGAYRGEIPLLGPVANPYPAAAITYQFDYRFGGFDAFREALPIGSAPSFGQSPVGFGNGQRANAIRVLGGSDEYDNGTAVRLPFKEYRQTFRALYAPTDSLTAIYDSSVPEVRSQASALGTTFSFSLDDPPTPPNTTYSVNITMWEVRPALTATTGPLIDYNVGVASPAITEVEPPGFTRKYTLHDFGNVTMPDFGGNLTADYDLPNVRPWLCMYATSNIQAVTLNSNAPASFGGSISNIRLTYFTTPPNPFNLSQGFSWDLSLLTTSFEFSVTLGGQTLTPALQIVGNPLIPRYYEAYLVGQIVNNP